MSRAGAGGRPRRPIDSASPELVELAKFLWSLVDESGLGLDEVHDRFTQDQFGHQPMPKPSTVYKRLRCDGLENAGRLVDAIVEVCTPPHRLEAVEEKVAQLKSAARTKRPLSSGAAPSDDCRTHQAELAEARMHVITLQQELFRVKEQQPASKTQADEDLHRLINELDRSKEEHRQLTAELNTARREIKTLKTRLATATARPQPDDDPELDRVEAELRSLDPYGRRCAAAIRNAFDRVYDGAHTGRFRPDQLSKRERTYLPAAVESQMSRELALPKGKQLDLQIGGIEVDSSFSQAGTWMFSPEAMGHICLLVSADDTRSSFSLGLLRITPGCLNPSRNRNGKGTLSASGRASIRYILRDGILPENVLLHTDNDDMTAIAAASTGRERVLELFRRTQQRKVDLAALRTVALQEDAPRRAREAKRMLPAEGVLVLGHHDNHVCTALELPKPGRGEYVSVRLARRRQHHIDAPTVELKGENWVIATPADPVEPVPSI